MYGPLYVSFVCRVGVVLTLDGKGCLRGVFLFFLKTQETSGFHTQSDTQGDTWGDTRGDTRGVTQGDTRAHTRGN